MSDIKAFKHSGFLIDIGNLDSLKSAQLIDMTHLKNIVGNHKNQPVLHPEYLRIKRELLEY